MFYDDYVIIDELVERVKSNDFQALWDLFDFYMPIIKSTTRQLSKKYKSIDQGDLISESVFILQDLCVKYEKDKSYFSFYLDTRLRPYLVAKIKSKYLEKLEVTKLSEIEAHEDKFDLDCFFEKHSEVQCALDQLSENYKTVIDLFYFKNFTQAECAVILGISQPAFNKKLQKVLKELKKILKTGYNFTDN